MPSSSQTIVDLEKRFWQAMVDNDANTAVEMLTEPAIVVSAHGAVQFDHATYRQMAEKGPRVLTGFELSDINVVFPSETTAIASYRVKQTVAARGQKDGTVEEMNDTSTWVKLDGAWKCAMHTETPSNGKLNA
jgi:ketosteroid isomerase-like protein